MSKAKKQKEEGLPTRAERRLAPKLPMEQLIEMSQKGEWLGRYFEPAKDGGLPIHSLRMQALIDEEVGIDSLALINFLSTTERVLTLLRKHLKRAKGKEAAKLKKTITGVEKTRADGMQIGGDGLTIQNRDWYALQPTLFHPLQDLYPDFEEEAQKPVSTYRMSKELNRETTLNPKARAEQLDMFIELEAEYREALALGDPITEKTFLPWVDLEPSEHALIDTFYVLLWKNSETQKKELESYYMGNVEPEKGKPYLPAFSFSEYELATTFYGGGDIGGKNVRAVVEIMEGLANKRFGMRENKPVQDGQKRRWKAIVRHKPLFCFIEVEHGEEDMATGEQRTAKLRGVELHPFFVESLREQYIEVPTDIRERTRIATGGKPSKTFYELRNYLLNEVSSKRPTATSQINMETAFLQFCSEIVRPARKREYLLKALEQCQKLGILKGYEETIGAAGQKKLLLHLNKEWARQPLKIEG